MYETINSPISLGNITLKNRIIFAPTSMSSDQLLSKTKSLVAGDCAMVIVGDVPVMKSLRRSLYNKKGFSFYQQLAEIAHDGDCKICAQLHQSDSNIVGMLRYIPGVLTKKISSEDLRSLLNAQVSPYISGLPHKKVKKITAAFGTAAIQAMKAGFDMVQVHGDCMCGSFSSSIFNKREDEYGGSIENRARFAVEAVSAIRHALPNCPIDYKLAVRQENPHYGNAGVLLEELSVVVPLLEKAGVTSFHVTLANHSELSDTIPPANHTYFKNEGCFLKYCDEVRKYTKLPICGVGGLSTPDFVETQLSTGRIDSVAMCRQLIADPSWVKKIKAEQVNLIHHCTRCNKKCLDGIKQHKGVHCIYEREDKK